MCGRFGTFCSIFLGRVHDLWRWNRQSVPKRWHKIQTPRNHLKEIIQHSEHSEILKSRTLISSPICITMSSPVNISMTQTDNSSHISFLWCNSQTGTQDVSLLRFLVPTQLHTHPLGYESSELVAEPATYTTHNKHKRRTCIQSGGFEPSTSSIKRLQYLALDRTVTEIGSLRTCLQICLVRHFRLTMWIRFTQPEFRERTFKVTLFPVDNLFLNMFHSYILTVTITILISSPNHLCFHENLSSL